MKQKPLIPFGDAVVKARKDRGISQYRLAQLIRRNPRQLSQIERNEGDPQLSTILLIARALRMEPGELVNAANALTPLLPEEPFDDKPPKKRGRPRKTPD